jgi:hypothetical protein
VSDLRFVTDVFAFIRHVVVTAEASGPVSRGMLVYEFGSGPELDAALSVLLLERRIAAYQRDADWVYSLASLGKKVDREEVRRALRVTNPELLESAPAGEEETVIDAAAHYFMLDGGLPRTTTRAVSTEDYVKHGRQSVVASYDVPRLDLEYDEHGGIRVIRAR